MEDPLSYDRLIMFYLALTLDTLGGICFILDFFGVGIPCSFVLDFIGAATIGTWSLLKGGGLKALKKEFKKKILKFGTALISELIPFWGDIAFSWVALVLIT